MLAEVPDHDKLVAFDAHRRQIASLADILDSPAATPGDRQAFIGLIVANVAATGSVVDPASIRYSPAVQPFFGVPVGEPPGGFEPPTPALGRLRSIH